MRMGSMIPFNSQITSPLSRIALARPLGQADLNHQSKELASNFRAAGFKDLKSVAKEACERPENSLHRYEEMRLNPHDCWLNTQLHQFFPTRQISHTISTKQQLQRARGGSLSTREVARCAKFNAADETRLFISSLKVPATGELAKLVSLRQGCDVQKAEGSVVVTIPSSAGLNPSAAASLTVPCAQPPCEYVFEGHAGALVSFTPHSSELLIDLFWTPSAYLDSLNSLQSIGRYLIHSDAIGRSVERGQGDTEIKGASALLSKAYEAVSMVGQMDNEPFIVSGVWGVAVLPRPKESYDYLLQMGVVGLLPDLSQNSTSTPIMEIKERQMIVVNLSLTRDSFGLVQMEPQKVTRLGLERFEWHEELPMIISKR